MSFARLPYDFLCQLGSASRQGRVVLIASMTSEQMHGIEEVAFAISHHRITIMSCDLKEFRDRELFLQQLGTETISFTRKQAMLNRYNNSSLAIISRMLRRCYIQRTIGSVLRTSER